MMIKKRVLIIINNLGIGGAERVVVDDVNEMVSTGIDVTLITLRNEPEKNFVSELRLEKDNYHIIPFRDLLDIPSWFRLVRIIRLVRPHLVVTHLWFANTIGRIAGKLARVKNIISFEQNVYDTVKTRKMFFVDRVLQFLSTKIIAVSNAVKKSLVKHGIRESKIDVLHNSINLAPFVDLSRDGAEMKKKLGLSPGDFLFVFVGRLIHQKAVDVLIDAFGRVGSGAYLLIVGQGKDRSVLEGKVRNKNLSKRVIFAGVRSDIPEILSASDCFVLPSRFEGLPLVLTEAIASGTAVIVSDFEAAREVIEHEKNGIIVPRENAQSLAQAMERIKDDDVLRLRLAEAAKKSARRFSVSNHVRAIMRYAHT